ncbi:glutamate-5-semialdehyde dehydrogenase [Roseivirga pacifica]|jgi:glutamate-5-semialdehyde dehydrogenase|uniref:glutamate-5-semialdehyde dehydrogenase n=1 Tax=Roseivirga pacifica TaxID=1267423 RepID=UPI002094D88F|nr:glutamate-5-semialdehyde dehydrogenase [Roseivirga pacifica]MCO6360683.1 glutamate-5-semialdehyde dehydrogenase [Roseivirga pacifica]MCO6368572.1 glutamate-5-semialdehyde dehydrogenase [Roseivirga pacifica]MCO6372714.1 glutamate-5-semialdehyde dehydrogenase [Roseivirga pacifica]MCO6376772.1 glutamate-5-semialdehyde dehydrogenase [Roseivirga pacifica]MCO6377948.1 glutamate-5-semialdehyde dehydrogenase [Roseivirga pacifica]
MKLLSTDIKNNVLKSVIRLLGERKAEIIAANKEDLEAFTKDDQAMYDRLVADDKKVDGMINSVREVMEQEDPVGQVISEVNRDNGLNIINKTAPFGTIMIIYESRPDVTVEAAVLAFKANNKILLKGGKEAIRSNEVLVDIWHQALKENELPVDWVQLLKLNRTQTQEFLKNPPQKIDLIVPRGGERLIAFVKEHAECPVLVSGRGNNFIYVDRTADWDESIKVILNAKTDKISACNALDKILIDKHIPELEKKLVHLQKSLHEFNVSLLVDEQVQETLKNEPLIPEESTWYEEFLALKACIGLVENEDEAIDKINQYSGGHSSGIMTNDLTKAIGFMEQVDSGAVYHNASTRFTDGGQMGVGAELAISTDKLHHRGPLGLKQLVTNKYYVFGTGQVRV